MNTYNKILENTYKLFLKKGLYNVSSEDISRASNISPGTLYYHFKNKDEIIENVLNKYVLNVYYDCLDEANNCNGDTFTRLTVFYKGILGLDNEYQPKYVFNNEDDFKKILVISFEGMQKYKEINQKYNDFNFKYTQSIRNIIENGKNKGEIQSNLDTNELVLFIKSNINGIFFLWIFQKNFNSKEIINMNLKHIWNYIKENKNH